MRLTYFFVFIMSLLLSVSLNAEEQIKDSLTKKVAASVVAFKYQDIPPEVIKKTNQLIADSIAVAVGAHRIKLLDDFESIFEINGGDSLVLHSGHKAKLLEAVYLNSMAANMLDFDDSHIETGHPGASIIQPALVLADKYGKTREELIEAIVAGYEFNIRWGRAVFNYPDKLKGPWSSSLLQAYGTTIAAAKLLDLNEEQIQRALFFMAANMPLPVFQKVGLVPGQTPSALKNNYGQASQGAVLAVLTALTDAQAEGTVLDGEQGLWRMMSAKEFHPDYILKDLGAKWETLGVQIKPYAACRWMHSAIDGLMILKQQIKDPNDIERIDVYTYAMAVNALSGRDPKNLMGMQFSIPHVFGLVLADESLIDMPESGIHNQQALNISRKVHLQLDDHYQALFIKNKMPAKVVVSLKNGQQLSQEVLIPKGEQENPIGVDEHAIKIRVLINSSPHNNVKDYVKSHVKSYIN